MYTRNCRNMKLLREWDDRSRMAKHWQDSVRIFIEENKSEEKKMFLMGKYSIMTGLAVEYSHFFKSNMMQWLSGAGLFFILILIFSSWILCSEFFERAKIWSRKTTNTPKMAISQKLHAGEQQGIRSTRLDPEISWTITFPQNCKMSMTLQRRINENLNNLKSRVTK